ncbi:MAG: hypothetical protein JSR27_10650 [Proteobacteria bacterium]|nr:hypothetical protein [Pseudomonadota bacterium]
MRLLAAIFSVILTPALALAQVTVPESATTAPVIQPVGTAHAHNDAGLLMPLWGTPDGRILALVALGGSHGAPQLPQAPQIGSAADWQLIDVTNFVGGGLSVRMGNHVSAWAKFGSGIALTPLNSAAATIGCGSTAFAPYAACPQSTATANTGAISVGAGAGNDHFSAGVDYGVAWVRHSSAPLAGAAQAPWDLFATIGSQALPTLAIPALQWADIRDAGIGARSHWRWNDEQSLDIGAALSRLQFELPGSPLLPALNQAALSFGLRSGNFSGTVTGRMLGPDNALGNGQNWTSIDLGISWRSPWRGVFSIGAQNLWSSGTPPLLADPVREPDAGQARVPYVQYHQDL